MHGREFSHIICSTSRLVWGSLQSCPRCGSQDIFYHLTIAEELLESEQKKNSLVFYPYKVEGCTTVARRQVMSQHKEQCLFRPVMCPKSITVCPVITWVRSASSSSTVGTGTTSTRGSLSKQICLASDFNGKMWREKSESDREND